MSSKHSTSRRAVSTMIGGIIVLVVFLSALVFMLAISEQYDAYQSTVDVMQQRQIDMFSENIMPSFPGLTNGTGTLVGNGFQVSCSGGGQCNNYTISVNNLGITDQVVRIYIYQSGSSCSPCILDPAKTATSNSFRTSDSVVNAGEFSHNLVFWLPSGISLSSFCTSTSGCKVLIETARGRTFSFLWPFPFSASRSGASLGGTGLYIGPLVITFQKALITYTTGSVSVPPVPVGGSNGYWVLPSNTNIIIYVKVQTDRNVTHDVYLTPQTVFEIERFNSPGATNFFYAIDPITPTFCGQFKQNGYNNDLDCTLSTYLAGGNTGSTSSIAPYPACGKPPSTYETQCTGRYLIPKPTQSNQRGTPVILAFAVSKVSGDRANLQKISNSWSGQSVTSFLGLSYVYDDGTGVYLYGVTLPFIALCIDSCSI